MKKWMSLLLALCLLAAPVLAADSYGDGLTVSQLNDAYRIQANCVFLQTAEKNLAQYPGDVQALRIRDTATEDNTRLLQKNGWTLENGTIYDSSRRIVTFTAAGPGDQPAGTASNASTLISSQTSEPQPAIARPTESDRYRNGSYNRYSSYRDYYDYRDYWDYYDYRDSYGSGGTEPRILRLSQTNLYLTYGDRAVLYADVYPSSALNRSVTWTSSDEMVATVNSSGVVRAVGRGRATIYVEAWNGAGSYCTVTVY